MIAGILLIKSGTRNASGTPAQPVGRPSHADPELDSFAWPAWRSPEVVANLLLKYSDGFRRRGLGIASILCVMAAFTALAQAVKDIELSLAYAIWGGFGILATVAMGWALFGQRLAWRGWLGLLLLLAGMSLLKLA